MSKLFEKFALARADEGTVGVTTGIAALGAWVLSQLGALFPVLLVLVGVMILDYITGLVKAGMSGEINSTRGWQGLLKKLMYTVTVAVAFVVDYILFFTAAELGWEFSMHAYIALLVSLWLIINEAVSVIENLSEIGVPMPKFLVKILQRVQNKVDAEGESAAGKENLKKE